MVDKLDRERMAANYGFAMAFLRSNDELWSLFQQAVKHTWDPNRFIAKLRDTKWFQTHSANVRNAIMQETADPATYQANVDQMYATVRDTWGSMFGTANLNKKDLRAWAETAHRMGWSEAQLVDKMTQGLNYRKLLKKGELGGTAAEIETQLDSLIDNYALQLGAKWKARQLEKLMEGSDTIGGVQNRVRELAKREYAAFADAIDGGATITEIADPYRNIMADLLEMNPYDISLDNKLLQKALNQKTEDGKPAAMSLSDFADRVRRDDRWQYTDNAREEGMSITYGLLQQMGLVA